MRYLIKTFDLDDARWLVLIVLAIGLHYSWEHGREIERRVASMERAAKEEIEERWPSATEWGNGSLTVDAPIKTTCEYVELPSITLPTWPPAQTCEVKPWQRGPGLRIVSVDCSSP